MSITFNCVKCGKQFRVGDELAGKKGKCPKCNTIFRIPETSQKKKPKPAAVPHDGGDPFAVIGPETPFVSEFASGEGAPPPRRPQKSSGGGLWISIAFLLILLGGAATAGFLHKDFFLAPPGIDRDLRYLPEDCRLIFTVNVDAILASSTYQRAKEEAAKSEKFPFDIDKNVEEATNKVVTLPDIRRVTVGISSAEGYPKVGVVRFNKAITIDELKATIVEQSKKNMQRVEFKEVSAGRFTMHTFEQVAMAQVGDKTLVIGEVEALRSVLERAAPVKLSPTMQAAFAKVDFNKNAVALVMDTQPIVEEAKNKAQIDPQFKTYADKTVEEVQKVEAFVLRIDLRNDITVIATAMCQDMTTAEQFKKTANEYLVAGQKLVGADGGVPFIQGLPKGMATLLKKTEATTKGKTVTVTFSTDIDTLLDVGKDVTGQTK